MMEIERKILEIDVRTLSVRIKKLRPKPRKLFDGFLRVKYFDFPDRRIFKKKDLVRVREFLARGKRPYSEIVYKLYKGVKKGCKYFEELEFALPGKKSFEELSEFLRRLGLRKSLYYEKKRTLYAYRDIKFEIDVHPKVPAFVEIEAPTPAHIEKAVRLLGLQEYEQSSDTIEELLRHKYKGIKLNGLVFKK